MRQTSDRSHSFWLTLLTLTFIANLMAARLSFVRWNELGVDLSRSVWGLLLAAYIGALLACLWLSMRVIRSWVSQFEAPSYFKVFESDHRAIRTLGWAAFITILILIPYVKFTFQVGQNNENPLMVDPILLSIVYYWMCWYALLLAMAALKVALH